MFTFQSSMLALCIANIWTYLSIFATDIYLNGVIAG